MKRFLHVGVSMSLSRRREEIERVLDRQAEDWFRYAPNCWILWTDKPINTISKSIQKLIKSATDPDEVLVLAIDIGSGYAGFMDPSVWEWLKEIRL